MITPELIVKILLSSLLGYLMLNSFFRYHFSSERFESIALILGMIVMFIFKDSVPINVFIIIIASIGVVYIVMLIITTNKKQIGYFLLNASKIDFPKIQEDLQAICKEKKLDECKVIYRQKTPFYVQFQDVTPVQAKSIVKALDKMNGNRKKLFNMVVYWHIVAFMILMVAIWRF